MITRFEVEGFKSFGSPPIKIELGSLNFVVGANASGKTNLLSALEFLKNSVLKDIKFAVNEHENISEVRNKIIRQRKKKKPISFRIVLDDILSTKFLDEKFEIHGFEYYLELDIDRAKEYPFITSEKITSKIKTHATEKDFYLNRTENQITINDPTRPNDNKIIELKIPVEESHRPFLNAGFFSYPLVILRSIIEKWHFFNISPSIARLPYRELPKVELGKAGENLSTILHNLKESNNKHFVEYVQIVQSMIPGFKEVKADRIQGDGKWIFQILEEKIRSSLSPSSTSDGTVRLLSLLVIAASEGNSSLVCIEEPENGLHPHLSGQIVEMLKQASKNNKVQMLITTHSPDFLDHLSPKEILLCDKKDGFTNITSATDIENINEFRKNFSIGELWEQGVLGGVP